MPKNNNQMKIDPKKLKRFRTEAELSKYGLALKLREFIPKINRGSIGGWEKGAHAPSLKSIMALSKVFKRPIEDFL